MPCPDDQALSAYLDGAVAGTSASAIAVEAHIDICVACRVALSQALRGRRDGGLAAVEEVVRVGDGGARVGRYLLREILGVGGMGVVYAARDPELDRRVAVKVLRDDASSAGEGDERLRAEAQTLARISHPNVLAVHDVGRVGPHRFLAMELVDGATLGVHLKERGCDWRERLRLLVGAGRGLAAAHAVGIVHCDVKPDNVLVGADGRPRVSDFGLARAEPATPRPGDRSVVTTAAGTPAYLAPELRAGARANAASDQFAFATMCWELLFDDRPASTPRLPRGDRAQRRVAAALRRGLAVDAAARWSSVAALVDALEAAVRRPVRRVALLAAVAAGSAIAIAIAVVPHRAEDPARAVCAAPSARAEALWSEARAAAVRDAFAHSGSGIASYTAAAVDAVLRRTALAWSAAVETACRRDPIGFAAGAGPVECLERRHAEAEALAAAFATADQVVVERAASVVAALVDPVSCVDAPGPPGPPRSATWLALARQLAVANSDLDLGRYDAAGTAAESIAAAADAADAPALRSEALGVSAEVERVRGHFEEAWRLLAEAVATADRAGADLPRARALIELGRLGAYDRVRVAEAAQNLTLARGAVARLGDPPAVVVYLEQAEADLAIGRGEPTAAIAILTRALGVAREADLRPMIEASLRTALGAAELDVGRVADALVELGRVLALLEEVVGPDHVNVGAAHANLANVLSRLGRLDEAEAHAERAVAILRAALGESRRLTQAIGNLAAIRSGKAEAGSRRWWSRWR